MILKTGPPISEIASPASSEEKLRTDHAAAVERGDHLEQKVEEDSGDGWL